MPTIDELLEEERLREGGITRAAPPGMTQIASPGGRIDQALNAERPATNTPVFTPPPPADREAAVIEAERNEAIRNPIRFGGPSPTRRNRSIPQMSFPRVTQELAEGRRQIGEAFTAGGIQPQDDFEVGRTLRNTAGQAVSAAGETALALGEDIGIDTFAKRAAGFLGLPELMDFVRSFGDSDDEPTGTEEVITEGEAPIADAVTANEDLLHGPGEPGRFEPLTLAPPTQARGGADGAVDDVVDEDFVTPQDVIQTPIRERQALQDSLDVIRGDAVTNVPLDEGGAASDIGLNFPPGFNEEDSRMIAAINNLPAGQRAQALDIVGENRDFQSQQFQDQTARITANSNAQRAAGGAAELIELDNGNQGIRIVMPDSSVSIVDTEQLLPIGTNTFMTSGEVPHTDAAGNKFELDQPLFFQGVRDPNDPRRVTMEKMAIDASNQVMSDIQNDADKLRLFNEEVARRMADGLSKQAATQQTVDDFEQALNE